MHESTRDRLETLLGETGGQDSHLRACPECATEIRQMDEQAQWIRSLRTPEDVEPAAGFYARVLQRIEEHARCSIWYGLAYSTFGKRLAYGSLSVALGLGVYVIAAEHFEAASKAAVAQQVLRPEVSPQESAADQRDAVLVNLASYSTGAVDEDSSNSNTVSTLDSQ